jgi:beta-lactamase regulating signal transducer with metallopeptidase domain
MATDLRATPLGIHRDEVFRWIGLIWLGGSVAVLAVSLRRIGRFQRLLKEARGGSWLEQDWVDDWARRIGLPRAADLCWVPGSISPMIWFVGARPRLIVPHDLWKRLDARQRSTLIVHELAHLRRGDHLVRLLEVLVTALFWWHPLVWWMRLPLREVEEQCCDAWVVWALPDAVRAYAETLLDTLEFLQKSGRPDPLLASGLGKVPHLRRRLTMIMTGTSRRSPGLPGKLGLFLTAGLMLPVGASWAQKADEPKDATVVLSEDRLQVIGVPVELTSGELEITTDSADKDSPKAKVVVVRVDDRDQSGQTRLELSGSLGDVIKKLKARIAELKEKGGSTDVVKELVDALNALEKASKAAGGFTIHADAANPSNVKTARVRYVARLQEDGAGGDKSAAVAKTREEISRLQSNLKTTVAQLERAQTRLRELGEDPGDVPRLAWHRSLPNTAVEKRFVITRDGNTATNVVPDVRETLTLERLPKLAPSSSDRQRLEQLEGRLKALQEEVARLKKSSADGEKK